MAGRKLSLNRETLAFLNAQQAGQAHGGGMQTGTGGTLPTGGTIMANPTISVCHTATCVDCSNPCGTDFCSLRYNSHPYCCG